ncbi:diguanylate cyclase [Ruminococcus sp. OA3]|uniref:GGDEF domain-containing protein n=1 Tax=Ruminococcus sp. OA3 TaxID=2914164 RepID=UPI001F06E37F|nr:diguanylate cyclase [Ruminococcus sp. OA3]MCH1984081.1 diguanylate cyclase [Ruminococcus sp. OA3]
MEKISNAEAFCRWIWYTYLNKKNYRALKEIVDDSISVIGTGEHEISRTLEEFAAQMEKEELNRRESFFVEDDWYQTRDLGNHLFLVIGQGKCREDAEDRIIYEFAFRFTMLVIQDPDGYRLLHVHQSVADSAQDSDEFFPRRLVEQSNQILQERIEEKTKELEAAHKQALFYARFDPLTKLMNRQFLEEKISSRMLEQPYGTMLIMDTDVSKEINGVYGHAVGDRILQAFSKSLKNVFCNDLIGRLGGDEFIVYASFGIEHQELLEQRWRQLKEEWEENQKDIKMDVPVNLSAGAAFYPKYGDDFSSVLDHAHKAHYYLKKCEKEGICYYGQDGFVKIL